MKTKEQIRAQRALNVINSCPENKKKNLKTQVKKLPERIITAGLPGAIAFLESKRERDEGSPQLISALNEIVNEFIPPVPHGNRPPLIERLANDKDEDFFQRRATDEVMAYCTWLKRFADARIQDEADEN